MSEISQGAGGGSFTQGPMPQGGGTAGPHKDPDETAGDTGSAKEALGKTMQNTKKMEQAGVVGEASPSEVKGKKGKEKAKSTEKAQNREQDTIKESDEKENAQSTDSVRSLIRKLEPSQPKLATINGRQPNPDMQKKNITDMVQDLFGGLPEGFDPDATTSELSVHYRQVTGGGPEETQLFETTAQEKMKAKEDMSMPGLAPPEAGDVAAKKKETAGSGDSSASGDNTVGGWLAGADSYTALAALAYKLISDSKYDKTVLTQFMTENATVIMNYAQDIKKQQEDAAQDGYSATRKQAWGKMGGAAAGLGVSAVPAGASFFTDVSMTANQFSGAASGAATSGVSGFFDLSASKDTLEQQTTQAKIGVEQAVSKSMEQAQQTAGQSFGADTSFSDGVRQFLIRAMQAAQKGGQ